MDSIIFQAQLMFHIFSGLYQGFTDFLFLNRLHQIIGTSEGQRFSGKCEALMTGLENTFNIYFFLPQPAQQRQPASHGHFNIRHHYVDHFFLQDFLRFRRAGCRKNLIHQIFLDLRHHPKPVQCQFFIIHQ